MDTADAVQAFVVAIRVAEGYRVRRHAHSFAELLLISAGRNEVVCAGHTASAGAGDLVLFRPHQAHAERVHRGRYHHVCLRIPATLLADLPLPEADHLPTVCNLGTDHRVFRLAADMAAEQAEADRWTPTLLRAQALALLALLHREVAGDEGSDWQETLRRIGACGKIQPIAEIAARCGLSTRQLRRAVRASTGASPKQHLMQGRLERARALLRGGTRSVAEVAAELDFSSPQYLARVYRRAFGITPSEERRR